MRAEKAELQELARESKFDFQPEVPELIQLYTVAVNHRDSNVWARQRLNYNTRYNIWANQSLDGRKWTADKGKPIFPWPGASDARVAAVDLFVNEDVAKLMLVWRRMRVLVSGTESNDTEFATRLTQVLRWMKYTQMKEARREMRLLANLMLERGAGVLGVMWDRTTQLGYESVDMEELVVLAMQAQAAGPQQVHHLIDNVTLATLPAAVMDPVQEEFVAEVLRKLLPGELKPGRAKRVVRELRERGAAEYPAPYLARNRPVVKALALNEDIFLPPEATGIQEASEVFEREVLTETALRERVISKGWDKAWVEEVLRTQRGRMTTEIRLPALRRRTNSVLGTGNPNWAQNNDRLYEVAHCYAKRGDVDGVPGIFYTVFAPGLKEGYGWHGLLNYDHGEYPYVLFDRETRSRLPDDSRGYGEVASTWQQQIKTEWDSRIDRASLATLPPSFHPPGAPPEEWGPGVQVATMRPEAYGFMASPKYDIGSKEVEESVWRFMARYFGRVVDEVNSVEAQAMQQELAENWMAGIVAADTQVLKLMQQLMPDEFYYRVVGSNQGKGIRTSRAEIQGEFDITVGYTMSDLIPEQVEAKLGLLEKALQMDVTGRIDRNEALAVAFEMIDPNLGERVLRPAAEAAQAEMDDEDAAFTKILAGIQQDVRPGQAYDLRLQRLMQNLQSNPTAQQMLQKDPRLQELMETRVKQLQHQLQQRENARIGVLGA